MLSLFGLSADQQAQREASNLNRTNTKFQDWDFGDMFRSAITGVSKEDVLQRAQTIVGDRINEKNASAIGDARRALSGTGLESNEGLRYTPGQTEAEFLDNLTTDQSRGTLAQGLLANEDFNGTIGPDTQLGQLQGMVSQTKTAARNRAEGREDRKERAAREHSNNQLAAQLQSQTNQFAHTDKQNRLDRAHERQLTTMSNDLQMQMKMMDMDLADKRMAYEREMRAKDKRAAMIAQLMKGLGGLGAAFG